mmetsp:Transcript_16946/g.30358  ORF Transcript_16946/g.30358 Transcript_16946/m.30358 type:complete len:94 (+) Transcript_16946:674-955(+)
MESPTLTPILGGLLGCAFDGLGRGVERVSDEVGERVIVQPEVHLSNSFRGSSINNSKAGFLSEATTESSYRCPFRSDWRAFDSSATGGGVNVM